MQPLPSPIHLRQLKNQSKDLRAACRAGEADALARLVQHHPQHSSEQRRDVSLQDASARSWLVGESQPSASFIRSSISCPVWRSYVLVEYPIGAMNKALMQQLQANNEMETRLRSTEAWQDLEEKVAAYEKWKESRGR